MSKFLGYGEPGQLQADDGVADLQFESPTGKKLLSGKELLRAGKKRLFEESEEEDQEIHADELSMHRKEDFHAAGGAHPVRFLPNRWTALQYAHG